MIDSKIIWGLNQNVRYRRLFNEAVLVHQQRPEALVLNDSATAFLEFCNGQRSAGEIIRDLSIRYDIEAETLSRDLTPFIQELVAEGILQQVVAKTTAES